MYQNKCEWTLVLMLQCSQTRENNRNGLATGLIYLAFTLCD